MDEIRAFGTRTTNAQLMADCDVLGYLPHPIADVTYGAGRFWTGNGEPEWASDLAIDGTDFRHLPLGDCSYATVVFDPPYKLNGTSTGAGPSALDDGYGVGGRYVNVADKMRLIYDGAIECARVTSRYLLVKCQDQVVSGSVVWQTQLISHLLGRPEHRMHLVDMLHVQGYRKQPEGRRQLHARRDYSTLLVFEKGPTDGTWTAEAQAVAGLFPAAAPAPARQRRALLSTFRAGEDVRLQPARRLEGLVQAAQPARPGGHRRDAVDGCRNRGLVLDQPRAG